MMTDAFMHVINDIKYGRLIPDSLSQINNQAAYKDFFALQLNLLKKTKHLSAVIGPLHPPQNDYQELKRAIRSFSDSMDLRPHTYVFYPFAKGDSLDSIKFVRSFQLRLSEEGVKDFDKNQLWDSIDMSSAIKKYQSRKGITVDGKISKSLVNRLNLTDEIRLKRIFITLDRYKLLRDSFPERYVWVNLPAYHLKVVDRDTIALRSKIICGKPGTQTPLLVSDIDELVTYPTWTVPASIIKNELLPGLKRNSGYLSKKGLGLYGQDGKKVDPSSVNWDNYKAGIPYKVRQSSGDNNALGVMKFNFDNPFFVYLHDTNQRGLFNNNYRALSHGCVRVQEWKALAFYIARVDSMNVQLGDTLRYTTDSLVQWLDSKKKRTVAVKNKVRLFIKYFTCEGVNGKMIFHDDIYDEDKKMIERFFAAK
jgi:murein L,D-transpeptidase YcbB/YkuD